MITGTCHTVTLYTSLFWQHSTNFPSLKIRPCKIWKCASHFWMSNAWILPYQLNATAWGMRVSCLLSSIKVFWLDNKNLTSIHQIKKQKSSEGQFSACYSFLSGYTPSTEALHKAASFSVINRKPFSKHYEKEDHAVMIYRVGGEALAQVVQRSCKCSIPGSIQGQVGWGSSNLI